MERTPTKLVPGAVASGTGEDEASSRLSNEAQNPMTEGRLSRRVAQSEHVKRTSKKKDKHKDPDKRPRVKDEATKEETIRKGYLQATHPANPTPTPVVNLQSLYPASAMGRPTRAQKATHIIAGGSKDPIKRVGVEIRNMVRARERHTTSISR